jgi:opine dehydrogenase
MTDILINETGPTAKRSMRVAVLGTGAVGLGSAALLTQRGHRPILWSPTFCGTEPSALRAEGALSLSVPLSWAAEGEQRAAKSCAAAVAGADAVLVAVPATAYRAVLEQLAPALQPGQPVLISGHLSFAALYLSRLLAERRITVPIVAWGTTVVSGRRTAPGCVRVSSIRSEVDMATLPMEDAHAMLALCCLLFGERFRVRAGARCCKPVRPQW